MLSLLAIIHSLIHSFIHQSLSTYYVLGPVTDAGDTKMIKTQAGELQWLRPVVLAYKEARLGIRGQPG